MDKLAIVTHGELEDCKSAFEAQLEHLPPEKARIGRIVAAGLTPLISAIAAEVESPERLPIGALLDALACLFVSITKTSTHNFLPADFHDEFKADLARRFSASMNDLDNFDTVGGRQ
ncbi:hypothetical protein [Methyloceanibacter caenitepidi]|uniref:Uncharacterized protein n=1 Tax=Methyloceanibacter caenitepidi TaxID=1384459 RepID=A0A0A8K1X2_9HYPH|nr:hypothetical protein [Methyloceanibacter caenitepidi]BAQ16953.1 hypothetical protein GL4_1497 [Methyloceanibacter caenitepidi]